MRVSTDDHVTSFCMARAQRSRPTYNSQYVTGIKKSVKIVEDTRPKIKDQARPEKIGSSVMGRLDSKAAPAGSNIGRSLTTRLIINSIKEQANGRILTPQRRYFGHINDDRQLIFIIERLHFQRNGPISGQSGCLNGQQTNHQQKTKCSSS